MKLHIGGEEEKEGWTILNAQKKTEKTIIGNICDLSQFDTESIEEVYASHVLEHVKQSEVEHVLKDLHRVLKNNGKLYVSVPDLDVLSHSIISPYIPFKAKFHIMRMIYGGQTDEYDFHYFGWNFDFMKHFLLKAGFPKCEKVESFGLFNDTSNFKPYGFFISLNIIAYK